MVCHRPRHALARITRRHFPFRHLLLKRSVQLSADVHHRPGSTSPRAPLPLLSIGATMLAIATRLERLHAPYI